MGKLAGGLVLIEDAAALASRALLPLAGMRAASARGLRWASPGIDIGRLGLAGELDGAPAALDERVVRALELAALVTEAEQALLTGDLDAARRGYLSALERAPRHIELSRRLAELDWCVGGRVEAALGTLSEALPVVEAGVLGGRLLGRVGDRDGAAAAFRRAGCEEPFGPLAALGWLELAALRGEGAEAEEALDEAVARAPALELGYWRRFEQRLRTGDLARARAEVQQLEAAARGAVARHQVLARAARAMLQRRLFDLAAELYERSLRYAPDDADAVAGLARSLQASGRPRRALDLLSRAATLAERSSGAADDVKLDLAEALVAVADDRPAAIAQVRSIPPFRPETFEARLFEARWRAELGDLAGAGAALGELGEAAEQAMAVLVDSAERPTAEGSTMWGPEARWPSRGDARAALAALLAEGAQIHEIERQDLCASRRLLELAMRLRPQHGPIRQAFRRVAAAREHRPAQGEPEHDAELEGQAEARGAELDLDLNVEGEASADEQLAEELSERLRADPADLETVRALAEVLERLGRDHDLLALLCARIDEGPEELVAELGPRRRQTLERLLAAARAAGNEAEAELFSAMLERAE